MNSDGKAESLQVRRLTKSEMEKQPFVGQRVNVRTMNDTYIVTSVAHDGDTVELLTASGAPSMLHNVLVSDLSLARAEPEERKNDRSNGTR